MNDEIDTTVLQHFLRLPVNILIFGKPNEVIAELHFQEIIAVDGTISYTFSKCVGDLEGMTLDLSYFVSISGFGQDVIDSKKFWNVSKEWWYD